MSKDLPFRPNVCMLVLNNEDKLFIGERFGNPGVWQFPQGGVEEGLSLEQNVLKELHEELGSDKRFFEILSKLHTTHEYDFSSVPDYAKGVWRGQKQTFWLVRFNGSDQDIRLDRFKPEFMNFRWCKPSQVSEIAEKRRLPGYLPALQETEEFLEKNRYRT